MLLYVQFRCGSWGFFTFQVTRELQPHGAPSVDGTSKGSSLLMNPISRRVPPRRCLRAHSMRGPGLSLLPAGGKRREKRRPGNNGERREQGELRPRFLRPRRRFLRARAPLRSLGQPARSPPR